MKNIQKKIDVLTYRFNLVLASEDDEATSRVLGEAEMLKQMIISMYSRYLGAESLDKIIKNINYLVAEFVKAKTLQNSFEQERENANERSVIKRISFIFYIIFLMFYFVIYCLIIFNNFRSIFFL